MGGDIPSCGSTNDPEATKAHDLLSKAGWEPESASNACANTDAAPDKLNFRQMVLSDWDKTRKALDDPNNALAMIPGEGFVLATGARLINFGRLVQTLRRTVGLANTAERSIENEAASEASPPVAGDRVPQSYDLQKPFELTNGPFKGARITRVGQDEDGAVFVENKGGLFGEGTETRATQKTDGKLVYEYDKPTDVKGTTETTRKMGVTSITGVTRKTIDWPNRTVTYEAEGGGLEGNNNLIKITQGPKSSLYEYSEPTEVDNIEGVMRKTVSPSTRTKTYESDQGLDGKENLTRITRGAHEIEILEYKTPESHDWMQVKTTEIIPQRNGVTFICRNAEGLDGPGTVTSRTVEVHGAEAIGNVTYDPPIPKGPLTVAREGRLPDQTVYENPKGLLETQPELVRFMQAEDNTRIFDYSSPQEVGGGAQVTRLTVNPSGSAILHNPAGVVEGGATDIYLTPEKSTLPEFTDLQAPSPGTPIH